MKIACQLCTDYKLCDILDMDEIGLNQQRIFNRILATKNMVGTKYSKECIVVDLTTNPNNSKKLNSWILTNLRIRNVLRSSNSTISLCHTYTTSLNKVSELYLKKIYVGL